ncbi:hypothetical protein [uncultured Ruminococcus sp.]|uniref:hypothetical protein n=1 Tax=uncultured Ruminococcus sp. TaxID=165186 RepID=UPI0025E65692|nr:hypothetical protein [uncultured Ruminococcus sp.]
MNALIIVSAAVVLLAAGAVFAAVRLKNSRRLKGVLVCGGVLICAAVVWFFIPFGMLNVPADSIKEVTVFSGQTGQSITVTDSEDISRIAGAFDGVKLRRSRLEWRSGYDMRVTFRLKSGPETEYIVNGSRNISHGMVIYKVTEGEVDDGLLRSYLE